MFTWWLKLTLKASDSFRVSTYQLHDKISV